MSNLVKKDPAYELIKEMISKTIFERALTSRGKFTKAAERTMSDADWSSIADIPPSELGWMKMATPEEGEAEDVGESQRLQLQQYLKNVSPGRGDTSKETLKEKIAFVNRLYNMTVQQIETDPMFAGENQSDKIQRILAYLVFMKTLTAVVTNFNASAAGFVFEAFLSVLLFGEQIPASQHGSRTIADLRTGDGTPISLKLYSEKSVHVGGSYRDLVGDMTNPKNPEKPFVQYIVAAKSLTGTGQDLSGHITIYEFKFKLENIFEILALGSGEARECLALTEEYIASNGEKMVEGIQRLSDDDLYQLFLKNYESKIHSLETDKRKTAFINSLLHDKIVEYASIEEGQELEEFFGTERDEGKKIGYGYTVVKPTAMDAFLKDLDKEQRFIDHKADKVFIQNVKKILVQSLKQTSDQRVQIEKKNHSTLKGTNWADGERFDASLNYYRKLYAKKDIEGLKKALMNSHGYLFTQQFGLSLGMMLKVINSIPSSEGAEIGKIVIGRNHVLEVIKKMSAILGDEIVQIYKSLKELNVNINAYLSSGLNNDEAAGTALAASNKLNQKTRTLQARKQAGKL